MKKNKIKLLVKKIFKLFLIAIIILIIYMIYNYFLVSTLSDNNKNSNNNNNTNISNSQEVSEYDVIKKDNIENYSGIGQQKVPNKDGYFTTFTTSNKYKKTYFEYKQNGNSSWSNKTYWGGTMAENGCGITTISIILSGYGKKYTPEDLRKKYYPVIDYEKLPRELSSIFGIKNSDFYYDDPHLSKKSLIEHLKTNRPIMICVWNKPNNNRWTTASHYLNLLATDGANMVYVSNPNGLENSSKSSGWYPISEIIPYIAKALYIESYT